MGLKSLERVVEDNSGASGDGEEEGEEDNGDVDVQLQIEDDSSEDKEEEEEEKFEEKNILENDNELSSPSSSHNITPNKPQKSKNKRKSSSSKKRKKTSEITTSTPTTVDLPKKKAVFLDDIKDQNTKQLIQDIIQEEDREQGNVSFRIYLKYFNYLGGFLPILFLFSVFTMSAVSEFGQKWYLQFWAGLPLPDQQMYVEFIAIYAGIVIIQAVANFMRGFIIFKNSLTMSREINFLMSFRLIHASLNKFFDRVPIGRIMNRFMKDSNQVDANLPWRFYYFNISIFRSL